MHGPTTAYVVRESGEQLGAEYWFENVRQTVLFTTTISSLIEDGYNQFIEVGPHPIHSNGIDQVLLHKNIDKIIVPSLRRKENEQHQLFSSWIKLFVAGANVNMAAFFNRDYSYIKLPKYPFQRERFWIETEETRKQRIGKTIHPHLEKDISFAREPKNIIWNIKLDKRIDSYIKDHRVQGPMVYPGAGLLDISLAAATQSFPDSFCFLQDVDFKRAVFIPEEGDPAQIRLEIMNDSGDYYIYSRPQNQSEPWTICAQGKMRHLQDTLSAKAVNLNEMRAKITNPIDIDSAYEEIEERGIKLGPTFRGMQELYTSYNGAYAVIEIPEDIIFDHHSFFIHPGILDSCFQAAVLFAGREKYTNPGKGLYIPRHVDAVKFYKRPQGTRFYTCSQRIMHSDYTNIENFWIFDHNEQLISEFHGLHSQYLQGSRGELSNQCNAWFYNYKWQLQENKKISSVASKNIEKKTWIIFADKQGVGTQIRNLLQQQKVEVIYIENKEQGFNKKDINSIFDNKIAVKGIIYLWTLDSPANKDISTASLIKHEKSATIPLLYLVQKLVQINLSPKICMVTKKAQSIIENEAVQLAQAAFRGVGRTIINEYPALDCTLVDLSSLEELPGLLSYLHQESWQDEVALRGEKIYINQLTRISIENTTQASKKTVNAQGHPFTIDIVDRGILDSIVLRTSKRKVLLPEEVEIQVKATSVNFRDIMLAMGLLSKEATKETRGRHLGMECSGVITQTGKKVTNFAPGDLVFGFFSYPFSGFAKADHNHVIKMPPQETFENAASLSLTYITAYYSLVYLCRLAPDEKILIHSAAGGVGIAAVQIAQKIGAQVYATVGNEEKKSFLKGLGVKYIYNSRTLEFANQIMQDTIVGVDVVLNSLSGPAIYKSMSCLAPFGKFVEIGKTDLYRNSPIGLKNFARNISYFVVDIDQMLKQRSIFAGKLLKQAIAFYYDNKLAPYPITAISISNVSKAFHHMASSRHIGKVVVKMEGEIEVLPPKQIEFKQDRSYLITGGCSGMGLEVAKWMAQKGAGTLALVSRSGPKSELQKRHIADLEKMGVKVFIAQVDITKWDEISTVFATINKDYAPLSGIIHSAMVLADSNIAEMTAKKYFQAWNPKVLGCWNLHLLSQNIELDFFVSFSSVSSIYGNPGQSNYAAGNCFLDEFAHFRARKNKNALTVNWGVLGEAGVVARNANLDQILEQRGMHAFTIRETLYILEKLLLEKPIQQAAMQIDWAQIGKINPKAKKTLRFSKLIEQAQEESGQENTENSLRAILQKNPQTQAEILRIQLRQMILKVLGTSQEKFDDHESITAMGLDSLMATQIITWIRNNLGMDYSMMKIMRGPSLEEFISQLLGELQQVESKQPKEQKSLQDKWIIRQQKNSKPQLRLFCFPYFGGGASVFTRWNEMLPEEVEVCAIQFPGREERMGEKPIDSIHIMIETLLQVLKPLLDVPFAFYSHSLGAVVSYELIKKLDVPPLQFIVGGWGAPHMHWPFMNLQNVSEEKIYDKENLNIIKKEIEALEIPKEVLANSNLIEQMMPAMLADIVMIGKRHKFTEGILPCPITTIVGENDSVFTQEQIKGWEQHTKSEFCFKTIAGGHLFIRDNKEDIDKMILKLIHSILGKIKFI